MFRVKTWNEKGIDFRALISFKNALFDCPDLNRQNQIPVSEFRRIRGDHDNGMIKNYIHGTEDMILGEICDEQGLVDLNTFSDIVDMFVYLPNKEAIDRSNQQ